MTVRCPMRRVQGECAVWGAGSELHTSISSSAEWQGWRHASGTAARVGHVMFGKPSMVPGTHVSAKNLTQSVNQHPGDCLCWRWSESDGDSEQTSVGRGGSLRVPGSCLPCPFWGPGVPFHKALSLLSLPLRSCDLSSGSLTPSAFLLKGHQSLDLGPPNSGGFPLDLFN